MKRTIECLGGALCGVLAVLVGSGDVHAAPGFSLNRFDPSEGGSRWLSADSLDISGHLRPAIGVVSDWAHKPLVAYTAAGDETVVISRDQLSFHLRASITAWERLRVGLSAPLLAYQRGSTVSLPGGDIAANQAAVGDLRLSADVRVAGEPGGELTLAVGSSVFLPTGNPGSLSGEKAVRVRPRLQLAGQMGSVVYAGNVAILARTRTVEFADQTLGSEVSVGGALGVQLLDERLLAGVVLNAATALSDNDFATGSIPLEAQLVAQYQIVDSWRVGAGFGPGLSQGVGIPASRVMLSAEWYPSIDEPEPVIPDPDRDRDGIADSMDACPDEAGVAQADAARTGCVLDTDGDQVADAEDACPTQPGIASQDPNANGCAAPQDSDGDGVVDGEDQCPQVPGLAVLGATEQRLGCPEPTDTDGDGLSDEVDQCPNEAGPADATVLPGRAGCPPVDTDGDGVLDAQDACLQEVGFAHEDPTKNGCPGAKAVEADLDILQRVEFGSQGAELSPQTARQLGAVLELLQGNPGIRRVRVEGHADSQGEDEVNRRVSLSRASRVIEWLVEHGIARERLFAVGVGEARPRASNDTPEGRQQNRRVEFVVVEQD